MPEDQRLPAPHEQPGAHHKKEFIAPADDGERGTWPACTWSHTCTRCLRDMCWAVSDDCMLLAQTSFDQSPDGSQQQSMSIWWIAWSADWLVGCLLSKLIDRWIARLLAWLVGRLFACASKVKSHHSTEHDSAKCTCCRYSVNVQTVVDDSYDQLLVSVVPCEPTSRHKHSNLQKETSVHVITVLRVSCPEG